MQKNRPDALRLPTVTLLGLAGNAPAYTIAITCWTLVLASKHYSAAIMFWCGLLVLGVAYSYGRLNRAHVSGGAAFTWVSTLVHPKAGFLAGWCLLAASVLFLVSAALPAAKLAVNALNVTETKSTVLVASSVLIILLAILSAKGVEFVGRTLAILTSLELATLVLLGGMLFLGLSAPPISIPVPTLSPKGLSAEALSQGIVIAIFFYWGWDVLFNASESTEDSARNSRIAGYLVIGALILMFVFFTAVAQQSLTEEEMKKSDGNVLVALSNLTGAVYLLFAVKVAFFISTVGAIFASFINSHKQYCHKAEPDTSSKVSRKLVPTQALHSLQSRRRLHWQFRCLPFRHTPLQSMKSCPRQSERPLCLLLFTMDSRP